jgi:hypothetical protein
VKKGYVTINAENFKNGMVLQDSIFPFGHLGHLITGTAFSQLDVKG